MFKNWAKKYQFCERSELRLFPCLKIQIQNLQ